MIDLVAELRTVLCFETKSNKKKLSTFVKQNSQFELELKQATPVYQEASGGQLAPNERNTHY